MICNIYMATDSNIYFKLKVLFLFLCISIQKLHDRGQFLHTFACSYGFRFRFIYWLFEKFHLCLVVTVGQIRTLRVTVSTGCTF